MPRAAVATKDASKRKRAEKDPMKPKRSMSAYMFFGNKIRPTIKEEHPDMAFGDVAKEISKRWAELSEAEKAPFNAQAEADKARYEDQMQSYTPANPTKKAAAANKPKRAKSAYIHFCASRRDAVRAENPDAKMTEVTSLLSKEWNALTAEEKKPFEKLVAEEKEKLAKAAAAASASEDDE